MKDHKIIQFLSRPALLHYIMPLLIIYLIIGTVAQKYIGLYEATNIFFSAPIIWLGPLPLPGYPVLISLIFISLACNLIFKSTWSKAASGIILTHMGAMLLILGGLLTALFSVEGYIDLSEGQTKNRFNDYHAREFVILDDDGKAVQRLEYSDIKRGESYTFMDGAFAIDILNTCRNCEIRERGDYIDGLPYNGMSAHMALFDKKPEMNNEENMGGVVFALRYGTAAAAVNNNEQAAPAATPKDGITSPTAPQKSALWDQDKNALTAVPAPQEKPRNNASDAPSGNADTDTGASIKPANAAAGVHLVLEDVPQFPAAIVDGKEYRFALRKKQRILPFDVQLIDFKKEVYPGTEMASGYQSRVRIRDGEMLWESVIKMNEPLRYKGYAFYQSSFLMAADGSEISVLAVVQNAGRSFPYISSILMCIGLFIHLLLRRRYKAETDGQSAAHAHSAAPAAKDDTSDKKDQDVADAA